jgi:hypothetical protein
MFREIIIINYENSLKHTNTLRGHNGENSLNDTMGSTYSRKEFSKFISLSKQSQIIFDLAAIANTTKIEP